MAAIQQRKQRLSFVEIKIIQKKKIKKHIVYLLKNMAKAKPLPRKSIVGGNWNPQPKMCHHNVTEYCIYKPKYKPVRGWLVFSFPQLGFYKFISHSALKSPDGEVFDITPTTVQKVYPFLASGLSCAEYAEILKFCENGELIVPIESV
jgi:hypothetical protein